MHQYENKIVHVPLKIALWKDNSPLVYKYRYLHTIIGVTAYRVSYHASWSFSSVTLAARGSAWMNSPLFHGRQLESVRDICGSPWRETGLIWMSSSVTMDHLFFFFFLCCSPVFLFCLHFHFPNLFLSSSDFECTAINWWAQELPMFHLNCHLIG